jgi:arsenical pump membrane protein
MASIWVWLITAATIAGILIRPREWPEAIWACAGAALLIMFGLIPLPLAGSAVAKGTDVYLFLTGMMLLADLSRHEGVFDWAASHAVRASKGSSTRLFGLVYGVGILVTVFLSNDATAVVLTPAVYAAMRRAQAEARPYLFACAFIANAASFVLPISNPANLVVYGKDLPPLVPWLRVFTLPSLVSIAVTFLALRWLFRKELRGGVAESVTAPLSTAGRRAVWGVALTGTVLILASAFGFRLGLPTAIAAIASVLLATRAVKRIVLEVSWSVLPLVAGLFVLVEAMQRAGGSQVVDGALGYFAKLPAWQGLLGASFGVAALSNVVNNLPSGLLVGSAHVATTLRSAVLLGVNLGPNLSVTGSLATVLWLIALRREGERVSGWTFLKYGAVTMTPALLLATMALLLPVQATTPVRPDSANHRAGWNLDSPLGSTDWRHSFREIHEGVGGNRKHNPERT